MTSRVWLVMLAALLPAQAEDAPVSSWGRYVARKGGFAVRLPGRPQEDDRQVDSAEGKVDVHVLTFAGEQITFAAYVHAVPRMPQAEQEPYLDRMRDGTVGFKNARLVDSTRLTKDGRHPGREMIVVFRPMPQAPPVTEKLRFFLVGDRFYELIARIKTGRREDPRADAFLDSFQLLGAAQGPIAAEASGPAWKTFRPDGAGFSVALPGQPRREERAVATDAGEVPSVRYEAGAGGVNYSVSFVDYGAAAARDPKRLLDATRDAVIRLSKGDLLGERRVTLGRYPGRDFEAAIPLVKPAGAPGAAESKGETERGLLRCRIYLVGRRVYQVMAAGPKRAEDAEQVDAFFKSFKLTARR